MTTEYKIRTKRGAVRRWNALDRKIRQNGGCCYGWDFRTISITLPEIAQELLWIKDNYNNLKD